MTASKQHPQRCETCKHYLKYACACNAIKQSFICGAEEWISMVGCASHSSQPVPDECGDNCKGECSGEVDGTPHCPNSSQPVKETHFTCWRGDCKLHDNCIHSFGQEYPPCVDACAKQAAKDERERVLDAIMKKRREIMKDGKPGLAEFLGKETHYLESLRTQQEQP